MAVTSPSRLCTVECPGRAQQKNGVAAGPRPVCTPGPVPVPLRRGPHLGLDGVEVRELGVELLELRVPAASQRARAVDGTKACEPAASKRGSGGSHMQTDNGLTTRMCPPSRPQSHKHPSLCTFPCPALPVHHPPLSSPRAPPRLPSSPQRRHGQGLQIQQLGGRRDLFRQDEVAEGDGQHRLAPQPLVAHHLAAKCGGEAQGNKVLR